jgi:hypothetical protein
LQKLLNRRTSVADLGVFYSRIVLTFSGSILNPSRPTIRLRNLVLVTKNSHFDSLA